MAKIVDGNVLQQNYALQLKFNEFQRQINQNEGYPYDFEKLLRHLQNGVEGKFEIVIVDQSDNYKESLQKFFLEVFDIDLTNNKAFTEKKLTVQNGLQYFMFVPYQLFCNKIRDAEKKIFDASWSNWDNIDAAVATEQERPAWDYWFAHMGDSEPDKAYRNKSYNQYSIDGAIYMVIKEYMLCRLYAYWLDKTIWDKKGVTLTASLDFGGSVMGGYRNDSLFKLGWSDRDLRYSGFGPRSAVLF